jgi:tetratricopeptide (TPR) repeat protein
LKPFTLICILIVACLTSCHVEQYVTVPVDYAPKFTFGRDSITIVLVNRVNFDSLKINNKRKLGVLKGGAYSAMAAAAKQLKFLQGVNAINLADSGNFVVNADSVKQLAANLKARYVLTLDKFSADISEELVDNNSVYSTVVNTNFTLYESNGIYFKKLNGKASDFHSEEQYQGLIVSLLFHPTVKGNGYAISNSARNAALDALKDYLPYSITNNRPLYTDDDNLQSAVLQIQAGKFDKAFQILNPIIDGADKKLASHAAYNLAVVYEAQGDLDSALDVARVSDQKQPNNYAKTIIADLEKE